MCRGWGEKMRHIHAASSTILRGWRYLIHRVHIITPQVECWFCSWTSLAITKGGYPYIDKTSESHQTLCAQRLKVPSFDNTSANCRIRVFFLSKHQRRLGNGHYGKSPSRRNLISGGYLWGFQFHLHYPLSYKEFYWEEKVQIENYSTILHSTSKNKIWAY